MTTTAEQPVPQAAKISAKTVRLARIILDPEIEAIIRRPTKADRDNLLESLRDGQKIPVSVMPDFRLLDGYTRIRLLAELGVTHVTVQVIDGLETRDAMLEYCIDVNLNRRHLLDIQRVELGLAKFDIDERRAAAERGRLGAAAGGRKAGRGRGLGADTLPRAKDRHGRETAAIIARRVGLGSGRQYERGLAVLRRCTADQIAAVRDGRMTINEAYNKARAAELGASGRSSNGGISNSEFLISEIRRLVADGHLAVNLLSRRARKLTGFTNSAS